MAIAWLHPSVAAGRPTTRVDKRPTLVMKRIVRANGASARALHPSASRLHDGSPVLMQRVTSSATSFAHHAESGLTRQASSGSPLRRTKVESFAKNGNAERLNFFAGNIAADGRKRSAYLEVSELEIGGVNYSFSGSIEGDKGTLRFERPATGGRRPRFDQLPGLSLLTPGERAELSIELSQAPDVDTWTTRSGVVLASDGVKTVLTMPLAKNSSRYTIAGDQELEIKFAMETVPSL